ncbi:MAG TPA: ATP-binding protein [Thermoanaerobaculia bacterium]|nr:ATP-binding protein [Thermoanaerobaculia bacterium]
MVESQPGAERCPRCGGRGWLVAADGGAGTARPCACRGQGAVARLLAAAGIPERYRHCKLANFQVSSGSPQVKGQLLQARSLAEQYANGFLNDGGIRESGLLFIGPPGVGKTHLAVGVLVEVVERFAVRARFIEFNSLIHQIQSTFGASSAESTHQIIDPLIEVPLLILDELGTQQHTPWVRDILYLLINSRYTRRRPTLFTTNYRLGAAPGESARAGPVKLDRGRDPEPEPIAAAGLLSSRLPPMIVSRLYEMTQPVVLTGVEDFRREHKVHGAHMR